MIIIEAEMAAEEINKSDTEFPTRSQQDGAWKDILDTHFKDFMFFFYPQFAEKIDWSKGYEILDKELQSLIPKSKGGWRDVDKLVGVTTLDGEAQRVLFHGEVQGEKETTFEKRLYEYSYLIYDSKGQHALTLVILTDKNRDWRPEHYQASVLGQPMLEFRFFTVKLLDYVGKKEELKKSSNPFAFIVLAYLELMRTGTDAKSRYHQKVALTRLLYKYGFEQQKIFSLYEFIDRLIRLPEDLEIRYNDDIHQLEEEETMRYITTAERIGLRKGIAEGLQKGRQEGRQEGEATLLKRQLQRKFSEIPDSYQSRVTSADTDTLLVWGERIIDAATLEEIFDNE